MTNRKKFGWCVLVIFGVLSTVWFRVGVAHTAPFSNGISHICIGNIDLGFSQSALDRPTEKYNFRLQGERACSIKSFEFEKNMFAGFQRHRVIAATVEDARAVLLGFQLMLSTLPRIDGIILSLEKAGYSVVGEKSEETQGGRYAMLTKGTAHLQILIAGRLNGKPLVWVVYRETQGGEDE